MGKSLEGLIVPRVGCELRTRSILQQSFISSADPNEAAVIDDDPGSSGDSVPPISRGDEIRSGVEEACVFLSGPFPQCLHDVGF